MFDKLEIMRMAQGMAMHAATRQSLVAENIANADTPGFRARDVAAFSDIYQAPHGGAEMRSTRSAHFQSNPAMPDTHHIFDAPGAETPNGNTVSLETEMVRATEVRHQHDMALAIYKSSLDVLRASIGRR